MEAPIQVKFKDTFSDTKECYIFEDPTNRVASLSQYQKALTVLFDPDRSSIEIIDPLEPMTTADNLSDGENIFIWTT